MYTELDQTVQNIVPVAWVFCYPLPHTKRTPILEVVQEFHVRQFSFVKSQPEKNRQLYKSLAVVICDLLNFPAIMPRPRRSRSLIWRHLVYHGGKQGWRERQKKRKEKRLSLFSILIFHHPLLALRAHLQPPALKSTLLAPRSLLLRNCPADDSLSTDVFSLYLLYLLFCFF